MFAGTESVQTVRQVSVKAGGSISIPCLYDQRHRNLVKYLCKGCTWATCSYEVQTNQPPSTSKKFLISDDKEESMFTVTFNDLMGQDSDCYWCIVEIDGGGDIGQEFHLSVTTGKIMLLLQRICIQCIYLRM